MSSGLMLTPLVGIGSECHGRLDPAVLLGFQLLSLASAPSCCKHEIFVSDFSCCLTGFVFRPWLIPSGSHGYTSASQCVAYYHDPKGVSYVNYNPCSYKYYFICKSTAVAAATTTQSPKTTAAPTTSTTPSP